ncbi:hypothetical protein [Pedobacter hartonius]|uniref:Uncharacterized protein n=1 Tax=Pedobacter hartonius TaxID=425514 RepID=A0A1H3X6F1_9SPHI|nr:hypothetical protein [Pedobacter hartonius]SDZ94118.1 hypothetical protein SAMN05443550_101495 [Pedobacter hartonius]
MSTFSQESASKKTQLLQKGKYVFTDELKEELTEGLSVPFFTAKAIVIKENAAEFSGDIAVFNISDLILRQSTYIDENGKMTEAHKLYIWPHNLGSTAQWTAAKQEFLNQYILNFPIEILSLQESNGVTWKFISPENFKKIPASIQASPEFRDFADHQEEYIFLRRPLNEPK